jgi:hypothetical protein
VELAKARNLITKVDADRCESYISIKSRLRPTQLCRRESESEWQLHEMIVTPPPDVEWHTRLRLSRNSKLKVPLVVCAFGACTELFGKLEALRLLWKSQKLFVDKDLKYSKRLAAPEAVQDHLHPPAEFVVHDPLRLGLAPQC